MHIHMVFACPMLTPPSHRNPCSILLDIVMNIAARVASHGKAPFSSVMLWLPTAAAQRARKSQVAVAIALQSVNTKEASIACVNEQCKIL